MGSGTYELNAPAVVAEIVDGEVIAINLSSGIYFSLTGWSAWAWSALLGGSPVGALKDALGSSAPEAFGEAVDRFVEQLVADRLIVECASAESAPIGPPPESEFAGLSIERYTDMADLILLDPVHDVDASEGWPRAAQPRG